MPPAADPTIHTSMGRMARLGTVHVRGAPYVLAGTCYQNGMPCLLAVELDGEVYSKLTTNLQPWPATPWSVLANHDLGTSAMAALASAAPLVVVPTDRVHRSGFTSLAEALVLPPLWTRDHAGDVHAAAGGLRVDVENLGTVWGVFLQGQLCTAVGTRPTLWQALDATLSHLLLQRQAGRRVADELLAMPRPEGAPCPQLAGL